MATTTNFGWETPDDTDLVKDGALAMRTLGNAIDTSLVDLKGGTTGQVLSKNTNTDMDFTWITQNDADAIQNSIVDAKGDLISATADNTPARLASSGVNGNVLTVDTSTATGLKWAAPAGGGKVLQVVYATNSTALTVSSTTFTDTGLTASITPTSATSTILVFVNQASQAGRSGVDAGLGVKLLRGSTIVYEPDANSRYRSHYIYANGATVTQLNTNYSFIYQDSPATTSSTTYKTQGAVFDTSSSGAAVFQGGSSISSMLLLEIGA